jgi:hypothetical protein
MSRVYDNSTKDSTRSHLSSGLLVFVRFVMARSLRARTFDDSRNICSVTYRCVLFVRLLRFPIPLAVEACSCCQLTLLDFRIEDHVDHQGDGAAASINTAPYRAVSSRA